MFRINELAGGKFLFMVLLIMSMKNFPIVFLILSIIVASGYVIFFKTNLIETFLISLLVINYGIGGLWAFMGHYFRADQTAKFIGWPAGNPFQKEIAFTNLAFGIMGILALFFRGNYLIAAVLGPSIFLFGAASVHIKEISKNKNMSPGNAGPVLYISGILVPVILISFLVIYMLNN